MTLMINDFGRRVVHRVIPSLVVLTVSYWTSLMCRGLVTIVGPALARRRVDVDGHGCLWGRLVRNLADAARPPQAREAKAPPMKTWTAGEVEEFLRRSEPNR
jgi:hypothetical protein